mgnify:CR=1 FL=1
MRVTILYCLEYRGFRIPVARNINLKRETLHPFKGLHSSWSYLLRQLGDCCMRVFLVSTLNDFSRQELWS